MKFCKIPPGNYPPADAYNLTVCAWMAQYQPHLATEAMQMAKAITRSVPEWEPVAANLAIIAALGANWCDVIMPAGKPRPSEVMRKGIERDYADPPDEPTNPTEGTTTNDHHDRA